MDTTKSEIIIGSGESEEPESIDKVCRLCLKKESKYTCPRCNTPYCTLDCYKSDKHRDCSEMFYKDCFMEGLKDCSVDPEEKRKVVEMLSRAENDLDPNDPEDVNDLEERLEDLDLENDTDQVWERLTEQEKKDFEHMISDGRLGNLVEVWTPWWKQNVPVVIETDKAEDKSIRPCVKSNIPKLSDLIKTKPSSDTRYNLLNILYAYAYVCRLHNGDHLTMATDSADDLIDISTVLGQGQSFGNVHDAMQSCFSRLQDKQLRFGSNMEQNISVINDILSIISCPVKDDPLRFILMALSNLCEVLKIAYKSRTKLKQKEKSNVKESEKLADKKVIFGCKKKCDFMLSWAQSYGMTMYNLVPELNLEYSLMKSDLDLFNKTKNELEVNWGGHLKPKKKSLVEEL